MIHTNKWSTAYHTIAPTITQCGGYLMTMERASELSAFAGGACACVVDCLAISAQTTHPGSHRRDLCRALFKLIYKIILL